MNSRNLSIAALVTLGFASQLLADIPPMKFRPVLERVQIKQIINEGNFFPGPGPLKPKARTRIVAQVSSNGCTGSEDFKVTVNHVGGKQARQEVQIIRIRPDHCRAFFPEGTEVELDIPFVGFQHNVVVLNPLRVEDRTTH